MPHFKRSYNYKRKKKQAHNRTRLHDLKLAETLEHRNIHAVGPNIGVFKKDFK